MSKDCKQEVKKQKKKNKLRVFLFSLIFTSHVAQSSTVYYVLYNIKVENVFFSILNWHYMTLLNLDFAQIPTLIHNY